MPATEVQRAAPAQRRISYRFLSLLISALLVVAGGAVMYNRVDRGSILAVWTNLNPFLVAAAGVSYWLQNPGNALRLQRIIVWSTKATGARAPSLWFLFKLTCSSMFVAVAAPIGLAGDAAKIVALRLFGSLSITESARVTLFDRVVGAQSLGIIGLVALVLQTVRGIDRGIILSQLALFAGIITAVILLILAPKVLALFRHQFVHRIAHVFGGYRSIVIPRRVGVQLAIAFVNFLFAWATLYLLVRAAGLTSDVWIIGSFIPLLQFINGLPFLYMGWGGRELAMAATIGAYGNLSLDETLAISIAWGVVLILSSVVNGVFLLGHWRAGGEQPKAIDVPTPPPQDLRPLGNSSGIKIT